MRYTKSMNKADVNNTRPEISNLVDNMMRANNDLYAARKEGASAETIARLTDELDALHSEYARMTA